MSALYVIPFFCVILHRVLDAAAAAAAAWTGIILARRSPVLSPPPRIRCCPQRQTHTLSFTAGLFVYSDIVNRQTAAVLVNIGASLLQVRVSLRFLLSAHVSMLCFVCFRAEWCNATFALWLFHRWKRKGGHFRLWTYLHDFCILFYLFFHLYVLAACASVFVSHGDKKKAMDTQIKTERGKINACLPGV